MSDSFTVRTGINPTTGAMEWKDKATGRTVFAIGAIGGAGQVEQTVIATVTLAQLNAGLVIVPADASRTIIPTALRLAVTGAFTGLTDLRVSDTSAGPVDIFTVAQAQLTDGAVLTSTGGAGITLGAGFLASLTAGAGVQVRKTGPAAVGGTSVQVMLRYILG